MTSMHLLLTSLVLVGLTICIPFTRKDPLNYQGRGIIRSSCAAPFFVKTSGKRWRSMIVVWWFLIRLLFFHCMSASRHSDSTPDSKQACSSLCSRLPRVLYGSDSTPDSNTAVVSSHELVSCGNGGNSILKSRGNTRGHVSSACTLIPYCVRFLHLVYFQAAEFRFLSRFFGSPSLGLQHLCVTTGSFI